MTTAPIILVPGFWLGAWAWDEVAAALRADGHDVTALTLPGLESADADRSAITLSDHVDAICEAVTAAGRPVVLAVHSGAGFAGYAASDRVPERIAAMVYVDSAPGDRRDGPRLRRRRDARCPRRRSSRRTRTSTGSARSSSRPSGSGPSRSRAASCARRAELTNDARRDVPSTVICTGFTSEQYKDARRRGLPAWLGGLAELRDVTWVDLPTSHWPMWSRPQELADIIGDVAKAHAPAA